MKVTQVYKHECEGCGAVKYLDFQRVEFGIHESFGKTRKTEADCINAALTERQRREKEEQERREAEERQYRGLLEGCARNETLRKLCQVFPDEEGSGPNWGVFDKIIQDISLEVGAYDLVSQRSFSSSVYEKLLGECIKAAREAS